MSVDTQEKTSFSIGMKLTGSDNYNEWLVCISSLLDQKGLLQYVSEAPKASDDKQQLAKTKHAIIRNLGMEALRLVEPTMSAHDLWMVLKQEYVGAGPQDVARLMAELKMQSLDSPVTGDNARKYFEDVSRLVHAIKSLDAEITFSNLELAMQLILGLPDELEHLRFALLRDGEVTPAKVRAEVLAWIKRSDVSRGKSVGQGITLTIGAGDDSSFRGKCWKCGKQGHRKSQCPSLGDGKHRRVKKGGGRTFVAMVVLNNAANPKEAASDWVEDTGSSAGHVTLHRDALKNYVELPKGRPDYVKPFGKKTKPLKVLGYGEMTLRLANKRVITLHKVAFAPDASCNIFGVRKAIARMKRDGVEATYMAKLRTSKIVLDDSGEIVATGTVRRGLYYLDVSKQQDFC